MVYNVLVSATFQKKFNQLEDSTQNLIRKTLKELKADPFSSRPKCDIKLLKDTQPRKYRLRIGDYRIIYLIQSENVKIIDLLKREIGYSRLE